MIPTEEQALEAQRIAYTTLVLDLENKKIGYVSKSKREVAEVHNFIKKEVYPESVFSPRKDIVLDDRELLNKLVSVNLQDHGLELFGITFKTTQLPKSPSVRIEAADDQSINESLEQLKSYWENLGLTDVNSVTYRINRSLMGVYSYGDEWQRRIINTNTKGKSATLETELLNRLKNVIGSEIKESKFVVKQLTDNEIIEKFLADKAVSIDPAIPKQADEVLIRLLRHKLIMKQKRVTKRRCEDWNCHTHSWLDSNCPTCGRDMIVIGEGLTIKINEPVFLKGIVNNLHENLHEYEVIRHKIQRSKYKKWVIRLINKKTNLSTFIVSILDKKDIKLCEALSRESYGLIAIYDTHYSGKKDELEAKGVWQVSCKMDNDLLKSLS